MKWIKLFEAFKNDDKIKSTNSLYLKFHLIKDFREMNLKKVETPKFIYFYRYKNKSEYLEFVFSKRDNKLRYSLNQVYVFCYPYLPISFGVLSWQRSCFDECLKEFFTQYINDSSVVGPYSDWKDYEKNFSKLKEYKS